MEGNEVVMIDQRKLPFSFSLFRSGDYRTTCKAIREMVTRGAGAIGAAAAFAMVQAAMEAEKTNNPGLLLRAREEIRLTRPTAFNLFYNLEKVFAACQKSVDEALTIAQQLADENAEEGRLIGVHGAKLITEGMKIATHCNAGWLGFVDYGSALSPVYTAFRDGKELFVFADETRPRSQGARLTAWELAQEGVPHTIIPDNATAWLMQQGEIEMMITGADRIAANGDTANKIGTLEKAIAAHHFGIPFYVAAPLSTFDLSVSDGSGIPIENRDEREVHYAEGPDDQGFLHTIRLTNPDSQALNPAFDVTPANLITGFITPKGIIQANTEAIQLLFSDGK
ncbi:MAG: S-methyl-5-thioribose-1-phosphate isomerase [Bacteroidales bacterium]